jgi:CubicO group peptidase (beta-lactamase class C family)
MKTIIISLLLFIRSVLYAQDFKPAIDRLIDSNYRMQDPGGVVLVAKHDKIIYERAFGMANMELGVPMQTDMLFSIASITKQFTAVAVLQLVQQGKLSLNDSVGKFIPDYPAVSKGITIEQLLTHTAGVPNAVNMQSLQAKLRGWISAQEVLATFKDLPLGFTPGSDWAYSNSGYQLLGYVIEKISNMPYEEYVTKHLLMPAGMIHSQYGNDMKIVHNRASCYIYTRMGLENAVNGNVQVAFSAGAIQATIEDFHKWYIALESGKLVSTALLQKAWQMKVLPNGKLTNYGYGWFVGKLNGRQLVDHGGNMGGFMSHAIYFPDESLLVAVFFNFRGKLPEILATQIAAIVTGKPLELTPLPVASDILNEYTGTYVDEKGDEKAIILENGKLYYQRKGGPRLLMFPVGKDKFYFDNTSMIGEMRRNDTGSIIQFDMHTFRDMSHFSLRRVK